MLKIKNKARKTYIQPTMEMVSIMDGINLLDGSYGENTRKNPGYSGELGAKPNNFPMFNDDELFDYDEDYDDGY